MVGWSGRPNQRGSWESPHRRSCFLHSRARPHVQLQKKHCCLGLSYQCEWACRVCVTQVLVLHQGKRQIFCSWQNRAYWTTALNLSVPPITFCLMDGKSCACVFTADLPVQGYEDSLATSELAKWTGPGQMPEHWSCMVHEVGLCQPGLTKTIGAGLWLGN